VVLIRGRTRKYILVIECKLKATKKAWVQLNYLYRPILEQLYPQVDIRLVQVVKNLNKNLKLQMLDKVEDMFSQEKQFEYATLFLRALT